MTTENQIAIACGWEFIEGNALTMFHDRWKRPDGVCVSANELERYFNSLDSMQSAVLAQDEEFQVIFASQLWNRALRTHTKFYHQLTVTDWQDSFVETLRQLRRLK